MPRLFWASALALVVLAGCGGAGSEPDGDAVLRVYVSLPDAGEGQDAADGARLALADAGGEAGGVAVEASYLDDGGWDPAQVGENARTATQDSTAIAYLGDFVSGASRTSVPITNAAGMLQVSPASSATDLVDAFPGSDDVPDVQASGDRTFGRVIPGDEAQARAAAGWVDRMDVDTVGTLSDRSEFGDDMVRTFRTALEVARISNLDSRFLYYGGQQLGEPQSLTQSVPQLMVTDAVEQSAQPDGTLATSAALDPSQLPPAGQDFADRFREDYGRPPGRYAAYGYEAMAVILDSINRASDPTDRAAVIDAFFDTTDRDSILGTYSIDETGETTLDRMTGYEIDAGRAQPVAAIGG